MNLQEICRVAVRRILRRNIQIENPCIELKRPRKSKRSKPPGRRRRPHVNLIPMQSGIVIMSQFNDSDSDQETGNPVSVVEHHRSWENLREEEYRERDTDDEEKDEALASFLDQDSTWRDLPDRVRVVKKQKIEEEGACGAQPGVAEENCKDGGSGEDRSPKVQENSEVFDDMEVENKMENGGEQDLTCKSDMYDSDDGGKNWK